MMEKASFPSVRPRFSTELLVMMETSHVPQGSSMVTSELTAPCRIFTTLPFNIFLALIFISNLLKYYLISEMGNIITTQVFNLMAKITTIEYIKHWGQLFLF